MSKRKYKKPEFEIPKPHVGRTYKLWSERSKRDFSRWLKLQSYLSPIYRKAYFISGIIILIFGFLVWIKRAESEGIILSAVGLGILFLLVLGGKIKL